MLLRPAAAALMLVAWLPAVASAQTGKNDPRFTEDPRDTDDPRDSADPRDVDALDPLDGNLEFLDGPDLFDELYEQGNLTELSSAMQASPWELLYYIDDHCEQWLELVESGALESEFGRQQAAQVQAKGRELARLADAGVGDSRFEFYVDTVYRWSAEERQAFRDGQQLYQEAANLYDAATSPDATLSALTPLRQSLARARELGDMWGQSMSLTMIGQIQSLNLDRDEARSTMHEAVRIGREIRDLDAVWAGLSVIMETSLRQQDYDSALVALEEQHQLSLEVGDEDTALQVLSQIIELNAFMRATKR